MSRSRIIPGVRSSGGGSATSLSWGAVTGKPDWVGTIDARVDALEAAEPMGGGFASATAMFSDEISHYFVIPNGEQWLVRHQNKGSLAIAETTITTEPTTLADVQTLEYS